MKNFYFNRTYLRLFFEELKGERIKVPKGGFLIFLFLFPILSLYSQQINVEGLVQSSKDHIALVGATISLEGTSVSTVSEADGRFSFYSPRESGTLIVGYVGYSPLRVEFNKSSEFPLNIKLDPIENILDDVQVIGYGKTTRRLNTGSVSSISADDIERQPVTNVLSSLSGRMPGVFVQTSSGLPGGKINIQIRGTGSIQAGTSPLYIIDGVPFDGEPFTDAHTLSTSSIVGGINPLNILNPNDIDNITVLKDADATAIYGSRGSNGVILITTKQGGFGETQVDFNIQQGYSKLTNFPNVLSTEEYLELREEAFANDNRTPSSDPSSPEYAPDLMVWDKNLNTNWGKYNYGNTSNLSNSQITIRGGKNNTNFNISGSFRGEGSILRGDSKYYRNGLQSSINHVSTNSRFKVNLTTVFNTDKSDLSNPVTGAGASVLLPPNFQTRLPDGELNWMLGANVEGSNLSRNESLSNNFIGNFSASYKFLPNIEIKINGGYNNRTIDRTHTFPSASLYPGSENYTVFGGNSSKSYLIEPQLQYNKGFSKSKIDVLLGGTYQSRITEMLFIHGGNYVNESLMKNLGSAGRVTSKANDYLEYKYVSAFGRITYNYGDKYIVNATIRRDGSSRFGPSNKYGDFYSIGGAWLFSEEPWVKDGFDLLSFGKVRVSYGLTGNDQISDYQFLSTYSSSGSSNYQDINILKPSRVYNSKFKWEATRKFELATELGFLKDRIFLSVNYYLNRSNNQLVNYPLPAITGFTSYQANLPAVVQNSGLELEMNTKIKESSKFRWEIRANITLPKNKLLEFNNIEKSSYANTHRIGYDITRVYGYKLFEVDAETGIALFSGENGEASNNPYGFHTLGKKTPDYFGGVGTEFQYKNLQINIFGQFAKQSHMGDLSNSQFGYQMFNAYSILSERWREAGDKVQIPKVSSRSRTDPFYYARSTGNFFDVPYFRLKNISLAYSFDGNVLSKLKVQSLRLTVDAHNLFTIWNNKIPMMDPEVGGSTSTSIAIAPLKSFSFGIHLTL